jgi:hypothetical protein
LANCPKTPNEEMSDGEGQRKKVHYKAEGTGMKEEERAFQPISQNICFSFK